MRPLEDHKVLFDGSCVIRSAYDTYCWPRRGMLREELAIFCVCSKALVANWSYTGWRTKTILPSQLYNFIEGWRGVLRGVCNTLPYPEAPSPRKVQLVLLGLCVRVLFGVEQESEAVMVGPENGVMSEQLTGGSTC